MSRDMPCLLISASNVLPCLGGTGKPEGDLSLSVELVTVAAVLMKFLQPLELSSWLLVPLFLILVKKKDFEFDLSAGC